MKRFDSDIEQKVFHRFESSLQDSDLTLRNQDRWKTSILLRYFDLVVYRGNNPLAVIEVKGSFQNKNILARATDQVRSALAITNARFGIVTDNQQFYFYDRSLKDQDFRFITFKEIIDILIKPIAIRIARKDIEHVLRLIKEAAEIHISGNEEFKKLVNSKSFLSKIKFDTDSSSYYFVDDEGGISSFENQFFIKMLGEFKEKKICRYTSLGSIFDTLNYQSFRMNGLVGMNDKTEVNYVESYLNGASKPLNKEHYNTVRAINTRYITSCSGIDRKDDLTMWRLYGDDAKGVCLVYDVKKRNLNSHVLLQKVKYADRNGKHTELEFLKQIKETVELNTGFKFEFRKIGFWKHFFKPYDYSIEEEVRLLVIDNRNLNKIKTDWVMTYTHSIINPVIDFELNSPSFPVHLSEIILGPKCAELETNIVQLKEMIRRKKKAIPNKSILNSLTKIKVDLSEITHYR